MAYPAPMDEAARAPELSVVVTVFNEASSIEELYLRTAAALEGHAFELIVVDDGSTDGSFDVVERLRGADERVRGVRLKRNFGQHPAMHAGLSRARAPIVATMDGDLQNPPEDPSRLINGMLRRFTGVAISDFGCAFNAYRREAVEPVLGAIGKQKFTKALVLSTGASVTEVDVGHSARSGSSRYSPLRLARTALHVLAGFWPQPIQWIGLALGTICTLGAAALGCYGVAYWVDRSNFPGPLFGGVAILFVLGVQGFILALVGEYLGRIQRDVSGRPLYTIEREL
jgi:undecaprenyl-phosphate 4-deoxy-4-formamido-L-arabinose transferase